MIDMLMNKEQLSPMFIADGVYRMFTGNSWSHLWYLYMLLGIYLLLPFHRMIAVNAPAKLLKYLLAVFFLFLSIIPAVSDLAGIHIEFSIQTGAIYLLYFFYGHAVFSGKLRVGHISAAIMAVTGTAFIAAMLLLQANGVLAGAVDIRAVLESYSSPAVVLQSTGIFSLLCGSDRRSVKHETAEAVMAVIDSCGFGIYLIHMVFLRLFLRYMEWDLFRIGWWSFFALSAAVMFISCGMIVILKRIPYVSKVL